MITIKPLGQITRPDEVMADAITYALQAYGMAPFPTSPWSVSSGTIAKLVTMVRARASNAGYPFTPDQVIPAISQRGYVLQTIDPTAPVAEPFTEPAIDLRPPQVVYETEPSKRVLLQDAITYVLKQGGYASFPYGRRTISQQAHDKLVAQIWERARDLSASYGYTIPHTEVAYALTDRGYVGEAAVILPAPAQIRETIYTVPPPPQEMLTFTSQSGGRQPGRIYTTTPAPPVPPGGEILPPLVSEKKSDYSWLLIAGLAALAFFVGVDDPPRSRRKSSRSRSRGGFSGVAGATANCVAWQEVEGKKGGLLWRCLAFAHPCNGKKCESPMRLPVHKKRQLRICTKTKKVKTRSPRYKLKTVDRCVKYTRVCKEGACIPEPFPKPEPSPGHNLNVKQIIREMAESMAQQRNSPGWMGGKTLAQEVLSRGGIRMHKKTTASMRKRKPGAEEFAVIPLVLRRKTGMPPDEMASEMGMDETELMQAIQREYPAGKKKKRRFTWTDFKTEAEAQVWSAIDAGEVRGLGATRRAAKKRIRYDRADENSAINAALKAAYYSPRYVFPTAYGFDIRPSVPMWLNHYKVYPDGTVERHTRDVRTDKWTVEIIGRKGKPTQAAAVRTPEQLTFLGLGAEAMMLFPGLKREMVLETEDISTSDDPLEIYLERKGWKMTRVMELQASMAEKAVPDLFTGKTKPLTAGEAELRKDIMQFQVKSAKAGSQPALFGRAMAW